MKYIHVILPLLMLKVITLSVMSPILRVKRIVIISIVVVFFLLIIREFITPTRKRSKRAEVKIWE